MPAFTWTIRVRYHECDPQGIVFNAHYFTFFDMTMTELLRAAFPEGGYGEMIERLGVDIVVAEATARFRGSARFDEDLELRATVTRLGTTGMTTALTVAREGDRARRRRAAPRVRGCDDVDEDPDPGRRPRGARAVG